MRKCVIGLIFVSILGISGTAAADGALHVAAVGSDPLWWNPLIYDTGSLVQVDISLDNLGPGLTAVQFALDLPDSPELSLVDVTYNPSTLHVGSPATGVAIVLVGCKTTPLILCTLTFQSTGISACYPVKFIPHPESTTGQPDGVDCNSEIVPLYAYGGVIAPAGSGYACAAPPPATNPSPADGAVNQPISPTLSWDSQPPPLGCGLGVCDPFACYGTDPGNMTMCTYGLEPIGPLLPNTKYYWRVTHGSGDWGAVTYGPVWSFTTTDGVGVEASTWGRIKALYR